MTTNPKGSAAKDFLDMIVNKRMVKEAFAKYVGTKYIQHNPQVPDGVDGAIAGLGGMLQAMPAVKIEFKRVLADGDYAVVHHHLKPTPEDRGTAIIDIFRFEGDKIVEHWDVLQPVPEKAAHNNTMF